MGYWGLERMVNFNSKCKTKYSNLTKEYVEKSTQLNKFTIGKVSISLKVNNNNNSFKNKIISSKNRNYNNLIIVE